MRYLKMLGLSVLPAAALMAFVGAGTASAANLYSTGIKVNAGTSLHATLASGTSALLSTTDGTSIIDTCPASTVEGEVDSTGGGEVTSAIDTLSWSASCSATTDTLTNGTLHVNSTGEVRGTGSVVTVNIGVSCRYGTGLGTHLGTLNTGKLAINAVIDEQPNAEGKKLFLCPDTTKWVANYTITTPHDVAAGA